MPNVPLFPATVTRCVVIDQLNKELWATQKGKSYWEKPGWAKCAWLLQEQDKLYRQKVKRVDMIKKFDDQSRFVVYQATYTLVSTELK